MAKNQQTAPEELRFAVLATDIALFAVHDKKLFVRTMQVNRPPHFPNHRALPGGIIHVEESAKESAIRILKERGAVEPDKVYLEQLHTFSDLDRDPRNRVVAVGYLALVAWDDLSAVEQADTDGVRWTPIESAKHLAYDHDEILAKALRRLQSRITYSTLIQKLLPKEFTLTELQILFEVILDHVLDKRNFRKKLDALDILKPLGRKRVQLKARPAELFSFKSKKIDIIPQL